MKMPTAKPGLTLTWPAASATAVLPEWQESEPEFLTFRRPQQHCMHRLCIVAPTVEQLCRQAQLLFSRKQQAAIVRWMHKMFFQLQLPEIVLWMLQACRHVTSA